MLSGLKRKETKNDQNLEYDYKCRQLQSSSPFWPSFDEEGELGSTEKMIFLGASLLLPYVCVTIKEIVLFIFEMFRL